MGKKTCLQPSYSRSTQSRNIWEVSADDPLEPTGHESASLGVPPSILTWAHWLGLWRRGFRQCTRPTLRGAAAVRGFPHWGATGTRAPSAHRGRVGLRDRTQPLGPYHSPLWHETGHSPLDPEIPHEWGSDTWWVEEPKMNSNLKDV